MRFEYKYYVPIFKLNDLRSMILPFVNPDKYAIIYGGEYTVKSIYYDSPKLDMYYSKVNHLANRLKVRVRGYNSFSDNNIIFLEIKRKYEGPIQKNRAKINFEDLVQYIDNKDFSRFKDSKYSSNINRFFYQVYSNSLQPLVNVIYEREAFHTKVIDIENDCRITFDKNIRSVFLPKIENLYDDGQSKLVNTDYFILEVKFNKYCPKWMKAILQELSLIKEPASKYVMSVENHCTPTFEKQFFNYHY